ncbi:MAG: hypothetical protein ACLFR1_08335 [Spirochaetia bacterium]
MFALSYYLSALSDPAYSFSGFEAGGRLNLSVLYASVSQVFAQNAFLRIEVGFELTEVLSF